MAVRLNGVIVSELRSFRRALEALRPSVLGSWPCACSCSSSCLALALALAIALALRLALPLVFALASAFFCSPEAPTWTPGGAKIDPRGEPKWPPGGLWARGRPQVAARPLRSRPWTALGALLAALGAVLGRSWGALGASWGRLGVPGRPRWIDGRPFWLFFWKSAPGG